MEEFEEVTTGEQRTVVTQLLNHKVYTLPIHYTYVLNLLAMIVATLQTAESVTWSVIVSILEQ